MTPAELMLLQFVSDAVATLNAFIWGVTAVRSRSYSPTIDFQVGFDKPITDKNPWGWEWVRIKKTSSGQLP